MEDESAPLPRVEIIDHIYNIAIDPTQLKDFIETWHEAAGPDAFATLDESLGAHLDRAQRFLQSSDPALGTHDDRLRYFGGLAAFVMDAKGAILAANDSAAGGLGATKSNHLDQTRLDQDIREQLLSKVDAALRGEAAQELLFSSTSEAQNNVVLFRVSAIVDTAQDTPAALVVMSDFQWNSAINEALEKVFDLTTAEQSVVRHLVDGLGAGAISQLRGVKESTVRGQIKSILRKMGLRSKTDLIRLVMPLAIFPADARAPGSPALTENWLHHEVWKPFAGFTGPDGRRLSYHDMGPKSGRPVLLSHMGSCMVRWPEPMLRLAFTHDLRIICPIRAGYGASEPHSARSDLFEATRADTLALLNHLGIASLPYATLGTDFPLAVDMAGTRPDRITEIIGIGGRPCLPDGAYAQGRGDWQRFFVGAAQRAPRLVRFAAAATMAMSRRLGSARMLRELCKDSPADLALIANPQMAKVLIANLNMMAEKGSDSAGAFAREYTAFYGNWSARMHLARTVPTRLFLAEEDPTLDLNALPAIKQAYPWIDIEMVPNAGLALIYEHFETLIPLMARAASPDKVARTG